MASRVAYVLSVENDGSIRADLGGGDIITADYYASSGHDALPREGDYVLVTEGAGAGEYSVAGFDDGSSKVSKPGENRLYSRDADGVIKASAHLFEDGQIVVRNEAASITISPEGAISIVPKSGQTLTLGGGSDAPSLASKTKAALDKIVNALATATPTATMDGGSSLITAINAGITGIDTDVASALVKTD